MDSLETAGIAGAVIAIWDKLLAREQNGNIEHDANLVDMTLVETHANALARYYQYNDIELKHLARTLELVNVIAASNRDVNVSVGCAGFIAVKNGKINLINEDLNNVK